MHGFFRSFGGGSLAGGSGDSTVKVMDFSMHSIKRSFSAVLIRLTCSITSGISISPLMSVLYQNSVAIA